MSIGRFPSVVLWRARPQDRRGGHRSLQLALLFPARGDAVRGTCECAQGRGRSERHRGARVIIMVATTLVVVGATFAIALGRAAALADRDMAELLAESWPSLPDGCIPGSYAGFASAHAT